jgi:hypothetical protein
MNTGNSFQPQQSPQAPRSPDTLSADAKTELLAKFKEPFNPALINWVVKATKSGRRRKQGLVLPYADSRAYTDRLDELVTTAGWTDEYSVQVVEGFDRKRKGADKAVASAKVLVVCRLTIFGLGVHSGTGECWADDDNVLTSADAQAFKRACSDFGIGRYLYDIDGQWVDLNEKERPASTPRLPEWAIPKNQRVTNGSTVHSAKSNAAKTENNPANGKTASPASTNSVKASTNVAMEDDDLMREVRSLSTEVGNRMAAGVIAQVRGLTPENGKKLHFMLMRELLEKSDRGERVAVREKLIIVKRGVDRMKAAIEKVGLSRYTKICAELDCPGGISDIPDVKTLAALVQKLEELATPKKESTEAKPDKKSDDIGANEKAHHPAAPDDQQHLDLEDRVDSNQADLTGLRNQMLALARTRASESNKPVREVIAWASNGAFSIPRYWTLDLSQYRSSQECHRQTSEQRCAIEREEIRGEVCTADHGRIFDREPRSGWLGLYPAMCRS